MQDSSLETARFDTFQDCAAYRMILAHYEDRRAERSGVPLINHIHEGLIILERIGASNYTKEAFCLHPVVQADDDLKANQYTVCRIIQPHVIMLAMEYRNIANAFLSDKVSEAEYTRGHFEIVSNGFPKLSPLAEVNEMLVADKVQNRKDFLRHHADSHQRDKELDHYFNLWLEALGITEEYYQELTDGL